MQDVEGLEDVLELRVILVEVGPVHVVPVAPDEGHALRHETVGALVELPHHVLALELRREFKRSQMNKLPSQTHYYF